MSTRDESPLDGKATGRTANEEKASDGNTTERTTSKQGAGGLRASEGRAARPRVTLHVVASLDGYIAKPDNSVSWLESPGDVYEDGVDLDTAEVEKVLQSIDCYVLGSHTYEHALQLGWPYGDIPTVVLSSRELKLARESVELYSGEIQTLLDEVLAPRFKNVWLVGGATLCQSFLHRRLVDEIILTMAPVTLGQGLRLFDTAGPEQRWRLKQTAAYKNGFVELTYAIDAAVD